MIAFSFLCLAAVAVDGDTLRCQNVSEANGRVRLARIDTPERGEWGFDEATQALAQLIEGQDVTCELVDADPRIAGFQSRDRFGRPVARASDPAGCANPPLASARCAGPSFRANGAPRRRARPGRRSLA